MRILATILCGVLMGWASAAAAQSADCSRAKTAVEKAICANPQAAAADRAMSDAYAALREKLPQAERTRLLSAQRAWLKMRGVDCEESKPAFAACVAKSIDSRTAALQGRAETGPGAGAARPIFLGGPKGVSGQLLHFDPADTPAKAAFNKRMAEIAAEGAQHAKEVEPTDRFAYEATLRLTYASPRLISGGVTVYEDSGGAHPNTATFAVNYDAATGRPLAFADLFDSSRAGALEKACLDQTLAQKKGKLGKEFRAEDEAPMRKDFGKSFRDMRAWTFSTAGARLDFDAYTFGSHAEGPYDCSLTLAQVKAAAKPGAPLPE